MLVFWPEDAVSSGWIIGWADGNVVLVATVVKSEDDPAAKDLLEAKLASIESVDSELSTFKVLGFASNNRIQSFDPTLDTFSTLEYTTVLYQRPDARQMRFFTIDPLPLEFLDTNGLESGTALPHCDMLMPIENMVFGKGDIRSILQRLNTSRDLETLVLDRNSSSLQFPKPATANHLTSSRKASDTSRNGYAAWALLTHRSCFFRQVDVRLKLVIRLFRHPHKSRLRQPTCDPRVTAEYLSFYNSIWLVLNDVILGSSYGLFLMEQRSLVSSSLIDAIQRYGIDEVVGLLYWLDHWPLGLKLNTELSLFLHNGFSGVMKSWSKVIASSEPVLPIVVFLVGASGMGGLSFVISAASDILAISLANIYLAYYLLDKAYVIHLSALYSLWNLFRGKRWNVLRNRVDSWSYDVDQLFLGSMLFTLLTFLFPTIGAYYLLFAMIRLAIILTQAVLDILLAFLNRFPLGALMLRLKDSNRLPGGICFVPVSQLWNPTPIFRLKNQPIGLRQMFHQHIELWTRLAKHYNPGRLFLRLLTGQFLDKIPRSSM